MKRLLVCLVLVMLLLPAGGLVAEQPAVKLWPAGPPGGLGAVSERQAAELREKNAPDRVFMVDEPTLTLYLKKDAGQPRPAVVVCPGGGYHVLAWEKEGAEVAQWLNSLGVSAAVLKYRVPRRDPQRPHAAPLQDAQRAVRLMRQQADQWGLDKSRIGMLGFSAGGNLTVMTGLHYGKQTYEPVDEADKLSSRPDFLIPIYPAYLGSEDDPYRLNELVKVDAKSPPTFLAVTHDDKQRAAHCALLYVELQRHGVPAELHIYSKGGHGYGLRPSDNPVSTWHHRCADWLRASGYTP